jgi:hypothetical protein
MRTQQEFVADFEYIKKKDLVVVPTFYSNKVVAYELR